MAHRVPLILFSSTVLALCASQVPTFNVTTERCVTPTLTYSDLTIPGREKFVYIYTMPPFTSSCIGRVVGYWFCYQNTSSTTGGRVATVLLLEDMGANYRIVEQFTVESLPDDSCLPGMYMQRGGCCVIRNLTTRDLIPGYLYGVVDLSDGGPNMIQTHGSNGHGNFFQVSEYEPVNGMLQKRAMVVQQVKMFQFIIGNRTSDLTTPTASTGAQPPTGTPPTGTPPTGTPPTGTPPAGTPTTNDNQPTSDTDETSNLILLTSPTPSTVTSTQLLQTSLVAGVSAALVVLLVVVTVVVIIVIIVMVMRRRNKDYALQQSTEGPAFMNAVYSGVGATGKAAEASKGSLPSSVATKRNYYAQEPGKSGPYAEPSHEYSMPDEIRGNTVPQHFEYAIVSQNQEAPPPPQLGEYSYADRSDTANKPQGRREVHRSLTGIYMTPARDETSLYAQFRTMKIKQISRDAVKVVDHLGSGQFGTVDRGVWQSSEGDIPVAVKTLNPGVKEEDRVKFLQEAAIMGQFSHPNVVKLYGVVTTDQPMMIVLELLPKGDLRNVLLSMKTDSGEQATPHTLLSYCRQIAAGMCYLSQKSFIHRDLAARNILVAEDGICKVADFGMSRDLADENYYISHGGKIPVKWTAPEALNFKKYSAASDVWSYSALMYEIWSLGHKPFEGYTNAQSMKQVDHGYRLPPPPGCPKAMYKLMIQCWHPETSGRPTFASILQTLSLPDSHLLQWSEADKAEHPEAATLGAELEAATDLYMKLQQSYLLDKDYETAD